MAAHQKETFSYHLPSLGTANPVLHAESAALYRFLLGEGEVNRLKQLDHLGTIRLAWEGAHHPRWEYVVSILHLIDRCASSETPQIHLKSRVLLPGTRISSAGELLRCWALLSNLGHLSGTFALERALLSSLSKNDTQNLLALLDVQDRDWARQIIGESRIYRFFQVLGFIRLEELMQDAGLRVVERNRWRSVYRALVASEPTTEQLDGVRDIYRNIRRLAFLALDSHYTPAVTRLDLSRVISDPSRLASLVLRESGGEDDLRGLEQFLTREIYLGRQVLQVIACHEEGVTRFMQGMLIQQRDIAKTIRILSRPRGPELLALSYADYEPVTRLAAWVAPPFDRLVLKRQDVHARQLQADAWAQARKRNVRTIIWTAAYGDEWVLQTHAPPSETRDKAAAWRYAFDEACDLHNNLVRDWSGWTDSADSLLHRALFGSFVRELIGSALAVLVRTPVRWEFVDHPTVQTSRLHLRTQLRHLLESSAEPRKSSRDDERFGVAQTLRWRPRQYAAVAAPVEAYNRDGRVKMAEFDGIFVEGYGEGGLAATFVEVKRQVRGPQSAAETALSNKLRKFAWHEGVRSTPVRSYRRSRLAWAYQQFVIR